MPKVICSLPFTKKNKKTINCNHQECLAKWLKCQDTSDASVAVTLPRFRDLIPSPIVITLGTLE